MMLLLSIISAPLFASDVTIVSSPEGLVAALAAAQDGDTLRFGEGRYGVIELPEQAPSLELVGGPGVILSGVVVSPGGSVTLTDLTISGGPRGLSVTGGTALADRVVFSGFSGATDSYAVRGTDNADITLRDVVVEGCQSPLGAVQLVGGQLQLEGVTLSTIQGPAVWVSSGHLTGRSVLFSDNHAPRGAAILQGGGVIELSDALFLDNTGQKGGSVYVADGTLSITDSEWSGGQADLGGHLYVSGGEVSLVRAHLLGSTASFGGGAVAVEDGSLSVNNALWQGLSADRGGAILVGGGTVSITQSLFTGNEGEVGAAAAVDAGTLEISGSILTEQIGAEAIANATSVSVRLLSSMVYANAEGDWLGDVFLDGLIEETSPRFVDEAAGNYALSTGSPAIDVGSGADLDGTASDMGLFGGLDAWPLSDDDDDGYVYGRDCDDSDPTINEAAADAWYDGTDSDCDGRSDFDQDGDGYDASSLTEGADCDDTDPSIHPSATELSDGIDSDCDAFDLTDADGDSWPSDLDCDDGDIDSYPGAPEVWYDGTDGDCSGGSDFDQDSDGHTTPQVGGDDCDDTDPFKSPSAPEILDDGVDQDCDGLDATSDTPEPTEDNIASVPGDDLTEAPPAQDSGPTLDPYTGSQFTASCATVSPRSGGWLVLLGSLLMVTRRRR
jgi:hypothetical protein